VPDLLAKSYGQPDRDGSLIKVTPESAGWEYVGFEVLRIEAGRSVSRHTRAEEVCLVPLSGTCTVSTVDEEWKDLGCRESVFQGPPDAVYLPPGTEYTVEASTESEVAIASAPAEHGADPMRIGPEDIDVEVRGSGNMEREIRPILMEDREADETLTFHDGDVVLVPKGYHVVSAPPGHDLYYLNVMAGPVREWRIKNHPDHEWLLG
jgi:5-deoxy-glucuronate isomerase